MDDGSEVSFSDGEESTGGEKPLAYETPSPDDISAKKLPLKTSESTPEDGYEKIVVKRMSSPAKKLERTSGVTSESNSDAFQTPESLEVSGDADN